MAHGDSENNVLPFKGAPHKRHEPQTEQEILAEIRRIFGNMRQRSVGRGKAVGAVAAYIAGDAEHSLGGDLMQVKAGLRAFEALITGTTDPRQWLAMLELVTQKVDTIMERSAGAVRPAREA